MKFEEKGAETVKTYGNIFIYFLLKNNEVVYVGKTTKGIQRPISHSYTKDYDLIKIIYCEEKDLDYLEDKYILKYKPVYNKLVNLISNYSLPRVRDRVRVEFSNKITIPKVKKLLSKLNIEPFEYNCIKYIKKEEFDKLMKFLHENNGDINV